MCGHTQIEGVVGMGIYMRHFGRNYKAPVAERSSAPAYYSDNPMPSSSLLYKAWLPSGEEPWAWIEDVVEDRIKVSLEVYAEACAIWEFRAIYRAAR
jgi:hypothetical protein